MQRFRSTWLALTAGVFLFTLSVSVAFGAPPDETREATRGQTIAAFVHELVFGTEQETDEEQEADEELLEEDEDDLLEADELVSELDPESDELVEEEDEESDAHGQCVSEVAQDPEAVGGPNENHGGAVSEAARETCWETDEDAEDPDATLDEEEPVVEEDEDAHGACVSVVARDKSAVGGKNDNHGGAISEAAREMCREGDEENGDDPESDLHEPKAERGSGKASWAGTGNGGSGKPSWAGNGQGGGNGRGGGRP
ncbi:MAG: hypothetical protein ACR2I5_09990 [Candidatus Limnocylindria bacterium]